MEENFVRRERSRFEYLYENGMREVAIGKLRVTLEHRPVKKYGVPFVPSRFVEVGDDGALAPAWAARVREAVDDMDRQYLAIRKARRELFDADSDLEGDVGCEGFEIEDWLCDEMVDWGVSEPAMGPTP
ncbi:hypothetical protein IFR05_009634 [Cadophora sp. M221]|nr:hypothetical protein IFR05_009634 [Cadophora sp. M221]